MNPFELAAKSLTSKLEQKGDISWDSERGWSLITGDPESQAMQTFTDFVKYGFRKNPVVSACVREVVTSLSEAPIRAFRKDESGRFKYIPNHEAEDLFVFPNGRDSYVCCFVRSGQHFLIGGNMVWWIRRTGSGKVDRLVPIRPDKIVGVVVDGKENIPLLYRVQFDFSSNEIETIPATDIVHVPDIDPLNEVFGMPRLLSAAMDLASDNEATQYVSEVLRNHGTPGVVVSVDRAKVSGPVLEEAEARWMDKFGPGRGRGKVAFVPGATHIKDIGFNLRDLEFPSLRTITRESICSVLGVDPILISIGSASRSGTMSGAEHKEARRKLWDQTLIPLIRRFEAALNSQLAPDFGSNVYLKFDLSEITALREARSEQIDRMTKMANAGSFTREEIREEGDFDANPPDGSLMVTPQNFQLVRVGHEDEGNVLDVLNRQTVVESKSIKSRPPKGTKFSVLGFKLNDGNVKEAGLLHLDSFATSEEFVYRDAALTLFDRERREVVNISQRFFREAQKEAKQIDEDSLRRALEEMERWFEEQERRWADTFNNLNEQLADKVSASLIAGIGASTAELASELALMFRERENLIRGVPDDTFEAIKDTLTVGWSEGEDMSQMARRVRDVYDEGYSRTNPDTGERIQILSATERSHLIARTETADVTNGAALATMNSSDIADFTRKFWLSQGDDLVRETHLEEEDNAASEGGIPLKEAFPVTGRQYPGGFNCRCAIYFEVVE